MKNEQESYKEELSGIYKSNRCTLNDELQNRIEIEVEQADLGNDVYESIKNIRNLRIDFLQPQPCQKNVIG